MTKYVVPAMIDGVETVSEVELETLTFDPERITFPNTGELPDSSTNLTEVAPLTNPVPDIVSEVPPVMGPVVVERELRVGTIGE